MSEYQLSNYTFDQINKVDWSMNNLLHCYTPLIVLFFFLSFLETSKRRSWSSWLSEESHAVEKTLKALIESGKVPGKSECVACIEASPEALAKRSWQAVKFYVKNRITAIQRESARRIYKM